MARKPVRGQRREDAINASIKEFGARGLAGGSADQIAADCGISQPYLFRLFGTKRRLFLAAVDRTFDHIVESWRNEVNNEGGAPPLCVLGRSYRALATEDSLLLMQLQAYAASSDPEIRRVVQGQFDRLRTYLLTLGYSDRDVAEFLAHGLLMNVLAALRVDPSDPLWVLFRQEENHSCPWCSQEKGVYPVNRA